MRVQHSRMIFDQAAEAFDTDDLDMEVADGRLGDAADGRVQTGTVAAAGQDANAPGSRSHAPPRPGMPSRGYLLSLYHVRRGGGRGLCEGPGRIGAGGFAQTADAVSSARSRNGFHVFCGEAQLSIAWPVPGSISFGGLTLETESQ